MAWLRRFCLVAMLITLVLIGGQALQGRIDTVYSADINDVAQLGGNALYHYNGIIFNYFEAAQADIEGAIAVGGDSKIGTSGQYDMGAAAAGNYHTVMIGNYKNPNNYPTLLLQNAPTVGRTNGSNNIHVYGGPLVLAESARSAYESGNKIVGTTRYAANDTVASFFATARTQFYGLTATLNRANTQSGGTIELAKLIQTGSVYQFNPRADFKPDNLTTTNASVNMNRIFVVNVTTVGGYAEINTPRIPNIAADYDLIVFNFPDANSVKFTGGSLNTLNTSAPSYWYPTQNAQLATYCNKVVWNFPVAQSIQVAQCGVVGSVVAPYAYVEANGGSINGMLVANDFVQKGGMELHGFQIYPPIFDFDNDDDVDEELGSILIYKLDRSNDNILTDVEFKLQYWDGSSWQEIKTGLVPDANGAILVEGLKPGKYQLIETVVPEGYQPERNPFEFDLAAGQGIDVPLPVLVHNTPLYTDHILWKVDAADPDNVVIEGAEFVLYREIDDGGTKSYVLHSRPVSEANGRIFLEDLTVGTYYLLETDPPDGYGIIDTYERIRIEVTYDGSNMQVECFREGGSPLADDRIPNELAADGRIVVSKVSSHEDQFGYHLPLKGAEFTLYELISGGDPDRPNDWLPAAVTPNPDYTDEFGQVVFDNLLPGIYKVEETGAPPGYDLASQYPGNEVIVIIVGGSDWEHAVEYRNPPLGALEITKVDAADNTVLLKGAEFELYRHLGGRVIESVGRQATGDDGKASWQRLTPGNYFLVETAASPGYLRDSGYRAITITTSNQVETLLIENTKQPEEGLAILEKLDYDNPNIKLPGAQFALYRWNDSSNQFEQVPVSPDTTDAQGRIEMTGLVPGVYKLVEIVSPSGYQLLGGEEVIFTIVTSGVTKLGYMALYNGKSQPSLSIDVVKKDFDSQELLAGAMFDLWYWPLNELSPSAANYTLAQTDLITDQNGRVTVNNLFEGRYRLTETRRPLGYEDFDTVNPVYIQFVVQNNGGTMSVALDHATPEVIFDTNNGVLITVNNEKDPQFPHMKVYKVDAETRSNYLSGAEFALYRKDTGAADEQYMLYGIMISNKDGLLMFPYLIEGQYRLDETKPPSGYELRDKLFYFEVRDEGARGFVVYYDGQEITQDMEGKLVVINNKSGVTIPPTGPEEPDPDTSTPPGGSTGGGGSGGGSGGGGYFSGGSYTGSTGTEHDGERIGSPDLPLYGLNVPQTGDQDYSLYFAFAFFASLWGILVLLDPKSRLNRKYYEE